MTSKINSGFIYNHFDHLSNAKSRFGNTETEIILQVKDNFKNFIIFRKLIFVFFFILRWKALIPMRMQIFLQKILRTRTTKINQRFNQFKR